MLRARGRLLLDYGAADASHRGVEYVRGQTLGLREVSETKINPRAWYLSLQNRLLLTSTVASACERSSCTVND